MAAESAVLHASQVLLEGVERILRGPAGGQGWAVLGTHMSQFPGAGLQQNLRRVITFLLDDAAGRTGGRMFTLPNGDIALLFKPSQASAMPLSTVEKLLRTQSPDLAAKQTLWTFPVDAAAFLAYLQSPATSRAAGNARPTAPNPASLSLIERLSSEGPAADIFLQHTAITLSPGAPQPIQPLLRTLSLSPDRLMAGADPAHAPSIDPQAFDDMAFRLDRLLMGSVLDALEKNAARHVLGSGAFNLALGVRSVLSEDFSRLTDARGHAGMQHLRFGVEIPFREVFADPKAFILARERLRQARMSVTVAGASLQSVAIAHPVAFQADFLKIIFVPGGQSTRVALDAAIRRAGADSIILDGIGSDAGLAAGLSAGISRFQGGYVDELLAADRMRGCQGAAACTQVQCQNRAVTFHPDLRDMCTNMPLLDRGARQRAGAPVLAAVH